jgi:hypothetical protein
VYAIILVQMGNRCEHITRKPRDNAFIQIPHNERFQSCIAKFKNKVSRLIDGFGVCKQMQRISLARSAQI